MRTPRAHTPDKPHTIHTGRRRRHGPRWPLTECGQSLVEFALVLPALLVLVVGGIQAGLVYAQVTEAGYIADQAAAAAARYGGSSPELDSTVQQGLTHSLLDPTRFTWHVETRTGGGTSDCTQNECHCTYGQQVAVVATYRWRMSFLFDWEGQYGTEKLAACWRGITPGGTG